MSMTAQQYKNNQIKLVKGIVHLSPTIKRKAMRKHTWEQSKSMSNLGSQVFLAGHSRGTSKLHLLREVEGCWTPRKD